MYTAHAFTRKLRLHGSSPSENAHAMLVGGSGGSSWRPAGTSSSTTPLKEYAAAAQRPCSAAPASLRLDSLGKLQAPLRAVIASKFQPSDADRLLAVTTFRYARDHLAAIALTLAPLSSSTARSSPPRSAPH